MLLDTVTEQNKSLLYMERWVDEGAKTYSPFAARTDVEPQYQPGRGSPSFDLVTVRVPKETVSIFQATPPATLSDWYIRKEEVLFVVHPETWTDPGVDHLDQLDRLPRDEPIVVAPTASTRTVLTLKHASEVSPHFIKLHLPRRISRFNRRLKRKNIQNSVALSRDVAHIHLDRFAYLPDALGFAIGEDDSAWGFLVRERFPRPFLGPRPMIPGFALYAGHLCSPQDPPLLVQMIERFGVDPQAFVVDEIMLPVVECWVKAVREWGILLESHAQNILLEIDQDFRPRRVVHRDFDVWVDLDVRRRLGLDVPFLGSGIGGESERPAEQHYSVVYDRFIGHEFFDAVLDALKRFYSINEAAVRARVSDAFRQMFTDADHFFPARTMFYFSNNPQPGREHALVDMKQPPEWR